MSGDIDCDEMFISQGPARHFAFADAVLVHTAHSCLMTLDVFGSSVPENDHYGLPQHGYAEDHPSYGFLIAAFRVQVLHCIMMILFIYLLLISQ